MALGASSLKMHVIICWIKIKKKELAILWPATTDKNVLGTVIGQILDKILTKVWTSNLVTWPQYKIDNTWTKTGHFIVQDLSNTKIFGQVYFSLTIFGQMTKIMDRILTIVWQNLVKFQLFWQILDIDKTWTKVGQMLDKTWTFVQNLSKFCPSFVNVQYLSK